MRLVRFTVGEETRLGVLVGEVVVDLALASTFIGVGTEVDWRRHGGSMRCLLADATPAMEAARQVQRFAERSIAEGRMPEAPIGPIAFPKGAVRLEAPLHDPGKLMLLGLNYRAHAEEHARERGDLPPGVPVVFGKFANAIVGPYDAVVLPKTAPYNVDYEAELAFVIGKRAKNVPIEDAYEYVAGYLTLNDISARDLQFGQTQWLMGKTPDTFAPLGPALVTRDEIDDPNVLAIRCWVNDELRQDSNTGQLIFDVPHLLSHLSQTITLEPGDIISTGTPSGVGYARKPPLFLKEGDVVRVEVEGIGALENPVVVES